MKIGGTVFNSAVEAFLSHKRTGDAYCVSETTTGAYEFRNMISDPHSILTSEIQEHYGLLCLVYTVQTCAVNSSDSRDKRKASHIFKLTYKVSQKKSVDDMFPGLSSLGQ